MSALKEFANFITLNVANLAATYDRLLTENDENCQTLPADGRIVFARKLIKTVAEACETETSNPLRRLFEERVNQNLHGPRISGLPHPLVEVECLGQTLTPVVTNLEAGKFLWQTLAETRAVILRNISDVSSSILSPPVAGEEDVLFSNAGSKQTEVAGGDHPPYQQPGSRNRINQNYGAAQASG
jgi:hypothetical protein